MFLWRHLICLVLRAGWVLSARITGYADDTRPYPSSYMCRPVTRGGGGGRGKNTNPPPTNFPTAYLTSNSKHVSSRKMRVLAHFTIHMVQLYTYQPHTWLGFRHHPCSNHMYGWTQSRVHGIIRNEPHCG